MTRLPLVALIENITLNILKNSVTHDKKYLLPMPSCQVSNDVPLEYC